MIQNNYWYTIGYNIAESINLSELLGVKIQEINKIFNVSYRNTSLEIIQNIPQEVAKIALFEGFMKFYSEVQSA